LAGARGGAQQGVRLVRGEGAEALALLLLLLMGRKGRRRSKNPVRRSSSSCSSP
jgi:hypothetical protein